MATLKIGNPLTSSINRLIVKSSYRNYIKDGNMIQLCSRSSHMSLNVCYSDINPEDLTIMGNGQIGDNFPQAHWSIEVDKRGHLSFKNGNHYLAFDERLPRILTHSNDPQRNKFIKLHKHEFRIHEILGSAEYFALESVKYRGRFLACLPNGSITVSRDKSQEISHFYVHVLFVYGMPSNIRPSSTSTVLNNYNRSQLNTIPRNSLVNETNLPTTSISNNNSSINFNSSNLIGKKGSPAINATVYQDLDSASGHSANDVPPPYSEAISNKTFTTTSIQEESPTKPVPLTKSRSSNFLINEANSSTDITLPLPLSELPTYSGGLTTARKIQLLKSQSVHYRPRGHQVERENNDRPESIRLIKFD